MAIDAVTVIRILIGIALLFLGRRLFWLFVGAIGFVIGATYAPQFFPGRPDWLILIIALAAGLVGALIAVFLQSLAIGLAGFLAGGYIALTVLQMLGWQPGNLAWLPFVIGGIIGAILVAALFDWALIILSSIVGAGLIVQSIQVSQPLFTILFLVLLLIGIIVQAAVFMRRQAPPAPPAPAA